MHVNWKFSERVQQARQPKPMTLNYIYNAMEYEQNLKVHIFPEWGMYIKS